MTDKRNPPDSVIMTGYNMIQARNVLRDDEYGKYSAGAALGYISQALDCAAIAEDDIMTELGEAGLRMEYGAGRGALLDAYNVLAGSMPYPDPLAMERALHYTAEAHSKLRRAYKKDRYRELTNDDFLRFGAGGNGGR